MWTHEVQLGRVVITGHEEVGLVLVGRRVRCGGLRRRCQPLEVELVSIPLAVHLRHDILVVVVPAQRRRSPVLITDDLSYEMSVQNTKK